MRSTKLPRKSPFRPWLWGGGAIAVFAVAGYVVLASALDAGRLQRDLQDAVLRQTGRELTVSGGVHLRAGLSTEIEVDDVGLANRSGGSRPQMLTAKRVRAHLALLSLLSGNPVISGLVIEQPDLLLERSADGTPNWQFSPEKHALYAGQGGSTGGGGNGRVQIRSFSLVGGQATWQPVQGQPVVVQIGQLVVTEAGPDAPMVLRFDGTRSGAAISVRASSGSLQRLQGGPVSALAGLWPVEVDARIADATLHLEGGVSHPDQGRGWQLRVTATAPKLEELNVMRPSPALPPLRDVTAAAVLSDGSLGEWRASQVSLKAGPSDLSAWAAGLNLNAVSLSAPGPGQLMQLNADGSYRDAPLRIGITAMQPDIIGTGGGAGGPVHLTLDAQAAGATLSVHGTVPPGLNQGGLDAIVAFHAPDLAALSPLAGRKLPDAHDVAVNAQVGDAGVKLRGVALRNLTVASSLGDLAGDLTILWTPRVTIDGTLSSRVLNLDGVLPGGLAGVLPTIWPAPDATGQAVMPQSAPPRFAGGAAVPVFPALPAAAADKTILARLRTTDADLNLSAGELVVAGRHYTDMQAHLQLADGKLALNPFRAEAPEGAMVGGASIDASSDQPPVAATLRSPAIAADALASALGYPGDATGTVQVDAQLSGVGQTWPEIQESLNGHVGLAMVGGTIEDSLVQGILGTALDASGIQSFGGGTSQVRCLALRVDLTHGRGVVRALAADTSRLALDGNGSFDLGAGTADFHLRPRIRLGPTEVAAPVALRGTFGQMRATLDPVVNGGRYGLTIGSAPAGPSSCGAKLALARGGLGGPMPQAVPPTPDLGLTVIRKPRDLLKGLFH